MWQVIADAPGCTIERDLNPSKDEVQILYLGVNEEYYVDLVILLSLLRIAGETDVSVQQCIVRYLGSSSIWGDVSLCDGG